MSALECKNPIHWTPRTLRLKLRGAFHLDLNDEFSCLSIQEGRQSPHGYVREHFRQIERELAAGVPYCPLPTTLHAAGFANVTLRALQPRVSGAAGAVIGLVASTGAFVTAQLTAPAPLSERTDDDLSTAARGRQACLFKGPHLSVGLMYPRAAWLDYP